MDTNNASTYQQIAQRALLQYNLPDARLVFIRHNENLTYQVIASSGKKFLLRIHLPRIEGLRGIQQERLALESEMAWILALRQDTRLQLQEPIQNHDHRYVSSIKNPETGEALNCTMLSWIDAEAFNQASPQAPDLVHKLGTLNATLHEHARRWQPPEWFHRPAYDIPELQFALKTLEAGITNGVIRASDYERAAESGEYILSLLRSEPRSSATWGIVHADLLGNLLVCGQDLIPIDFSLSGFAYYLFDMGICVCNLKKPLRQLYLEGYGQSLTGRQTHLISAFILMIIFIACARYVANPEWVEWFQRRFTVIARNFCPALLAGESFLFEI